MAVRLLDGAIGAVPLKQDDRGVWSGEVEGVAPGDRYLFRLDDEQELPDPASRHQPEGVHGASAVVDPSFPWTDDAFRCPALSDFVLYEMHVGTFTPEGTFDAVIPWLPELRELGVTALEIMPVGEFPGSRNWGYDGVFPFAAQSSYGGPDGLRRLVDACHVQGLAVVLDVVYNHLGPEGNVLGAYAPYFTDRYRTPWGDALNFDGPWSDEVRCYFIESALYFAETCHVDAFRVDAIHAIVDTSARPFLQELGEKIHERGRQLGRNLFVIAESDLNDSRVVRPREAGGLGLDGQWCDDFHHAVHALFTGERQGYYQDFGTLEDVVTAMRRAFVYTGQYSPYRQRRHGNSTEGCPGKQFVVFVQNHDQVGNRARGDRWTATLSFPELRVAAALYLLSPYVPLIFMGEEYGETAPFQYFTSHSDPALGEAVRNGRRSEFTAFGWREEDIPDPQDPATFECSRLDGSLRERSPHRELREFYRACLQLRRERAALGPRDADETDVRILGSNRVLRVDRLGADDQVVGLFALERQSETLAVELRPGRWRVALDTEDGTWGGGARPDRWSETDSEGTVEIELGGPRGLLLVPV